MADLKLAYQTIELTKALELFHAKDTVFVDLREKKYFDYGSIQGAENLDPNQIKTLDPGTIKRWKEKASVVVYCNGIGCPLVFFEAKSLAQKGLDNIKVYSGGWPEWRSSGLPMTMSAAMKKDEVAREQ